MFKKFILLISILTALTGCTENQTKETVINQFNGHEIQISLKNTDLKEGDLVRLYHYKIAARGGRKKETVEIAQVRQNNNEQGVIVLSSGNQIQAPVFLEKIN